MVQLLYQLVDEMDPSWKVPFSAVIAGPSGCGKSHFVARFIKHLNVMVDKPIVEIIWCYAEWQSLYDTLQKEHSIRFHKGIIDSDEIPSGSGARIVIIDDLMREADERVVDLFTKGGHHRNLCILFLLQNIFTQGKGRRDISLNAHYAVCFKNPRDRAQIMHLSRQVAPQNPKFVQEAFEDATKEAHGYLLFDFKQSTPDLLRLRTSIFPDDAESIVYIPKTSSIKSDYVVNLHSFDHDG